MPTNRRQRRQRRRADVTELTADQEHHLLDGWNWFGGFRTLEDFQEAWELHRERLLPAFIAEHPGRRPFAWWRLDHGRERPVLHTEWNEKWGWSSPERLDQERNDTRHGNTFGFLHTSLIPPLQESEVDYLDRHGLLSAAERKALGRPKP